MASRYSPTCAKSSMSKAKHERMESPKMKAVEKKMGGKS